MLIILISLFLGVNFYFLIALTPNAKVSRTIKFYGCLAITRDHPDKVRDDSFFVEYDTTLTEKEIENHIHKMGFNYSSIKVINDYYLILMHNEKIKKENPKNIVKATDAEFAKFSEYILNHSLLITLAIRNPKGIMAMKVEFQRDVPPEMSKKILNKIILDYNNEIWTNNSPYYFNERQSWAHILIPEGSGITEVEGYCKFLVEEEVIGAQLVPDIFHIS